jgi:anti-anti-sigma regulatory factor
MIRLEGTVDISSAAELKALLIESLGSGSKVQVVLAETTDLDVTAVQLLWAANRQARASGVDVSILDRIPGPVSTALLQDGFEDFRATADSFQANEVSPCQP